MSVDLREWYDIYASPENAVQILDGELLTGVLDKAAFGATEFGLVHSVRQLLSGEITRDVPR